MQAINLEEVNAKLDSFKNQDVYIHLETTNGAYASHFDNQGVNVGAYIRNAKINFSEAKVLGEAGSYRAGLKMVHGWVYAEGLSDYEVLDAETLLLAGHDADGRLTVALQISTQAFQ